MKRFYATFANHHILRLETIAAIPGFVAGGTLHLNTLRSMYATVLTQIVMQFNASCSGATTSGSSLSWMSPKMSVCIS
jgi:hypothetical protein